MSFAGDNHVTTREFLDHWQHKDLGTLDKGLQLFMNLDVNKDWVIDMDRDMMYIFLWFDVNSMHFSCFLFWDISLHEVVFLRTLFYLKSFVTKSVNQYLLRTVATDQLELDIERKY